MEGKENGYRRSLFHKKIINQVSKKIFKFVRLHSKVLRDFSSGGGPSQVYGLSILKVSFEPGLF